MRKLLCHCSPTAATRAGPLVLLRPRPDRRGGGEERLPPLCVLPPPLPQGLPESGGREDERLTAILDAVTKVKVPGLLRRKEGNSSRT